MKLEKICKILTLLFIASIPMMPMFTIKVHYALGFACMFIYFIDVIRKKKFDKFTWFEMGYLIFLIYSFIRIDKNMANQFEKYLSDAYFRIKIMLFNFASIVVSVRILYSFTKDFKKTFEMIGNTFLISTVIVSIYSIIYEYFIIGDIQRLGTYVFAEEYGTRITYTHNIMISLFFVMYNIFNKPKKYISGAVLIFLIVVTLLSGTRKLLVALPLFILIYAFLNPKQNKLALLRYIIIFILCLPILYYCMIKVDVLYDLFGSRVDSLIQQVVGESQDASSAQRERMQDRAIKYFSQNKLIGIGTEGFKFRFAKSTGILKYSHNNYTEILCNLGIIGFIIYYGTLVIILIKLFLKPKKEFNSLDMFFCASMITILVLDIWNVSYYRIQFLLIYALAAFYLLIENRKGKNIEYNLENIIEKVTIKLKGK